MSEDVNLQIFNKKIEEMKKKHMKWVQENFIEPLAQKGREALDEYLTNVERLRNETFSRS